MIRELKKSFTRNRIIYLVYFAAIILYTFATIIIPGFGRGSQITVLLKQMVIMGILAAGQTLVIITGGLDLSIPWSLNSAAILLTYFSHGKNINLGWIIIIILVINSLFGLINGFGISYLKIPPIIMTLGLNGILQGGLLVLLKGAPGGKAPSYLVKFCSGTFGRIPYMLIVWIIVSVIIIVLLQKTTYGRQLYVVGNNERVAIFSGIKAKRLKLIAYIICGFTTGLAGILLAGRFEQSYLGMGNPYLFPPIVAVVLGGIALSGGSGSYVGTIGGTAILVILTAFLSAINLSTSLQQILYGAILMLVIIVIPENSRKKE
jgi:ribose transport system permease protein